MQCGRCGHENKLEARYCALCGGELTAPPAPAVGASVTPVYSAPAFRDDWTEGSLDIRFAAAPLASIPDTLARTLEWYWANFGTIVILVVLIFLPAELGKNILVYSAGWQDDLRAVSRFDRLINLLLSSLLAPSIIYALVIRLRDSRKARLSEAFGWGIRRWGRTVGYRLVAGLAIAGGCLLLIVPGIIAAIWLALTDAVVAIEGRAQPGVLSRSRELTTGHRRHILGSGAVIFLVVVISATAFGATITVVSDNWYTSTISDLAADAAIALFSVYVVVLYCGIVCRTPIAYANSGAPSPEDGRGACPTCGAAAPPIEQGCASPRGALKHSGPGGGGFALALTGGMVYCTMCAIAAFAGAVHPESLENEDSPLPILILLGLACGAVLCLIAATLGLVALLQRERRRTLGVAGLTIGLVVIASTGVIVLQSLYGEG